MEGDLIGFVFGGAGADRAPVGAAGSYKAGLVGSTPTRSKMKMAPSILERIVSCDHCFSL